MDARKLVCRPGEGRDPSRRWRDEPANRTAAFAGVIRWRDVPDRPEHMLATDIPDWTITTTTPTRVRGNDEDERAVVPANENELTVISANEDELAVVSANAGRRR